MYIETPKGHVPDWQRQELLKHEEEKSRQEAQTIPFSDEERQVRLELLRKFKRRS